MPCRENIYSSPVLAALLVMTVLPCSSFAVAPAAAPAFPGAATEAPPAIKADPVIAGLDGRLIYLSDLARAASLLPEPLRGLPLETTMPVLLDRMIDHEALTMTARQAGLDSNPEVRRAMRAASDQVLEGAWLAGVAPAKVTEAAIVALYARQYLNRPAAEEVRARHILAGTEAEAKAVLDQLKQGADFAALARTASKDPDGKNGGELGFFRRDQVWPGFADAVFALQPGQVDPAPIHNAFGWHVVEVEERRLTSAPTLSDVHEQLRQALLAQAVREAVADARSRMNIRKFNLDGSDMDAGLARR
jgi:peptidyl-prolyl cis-trans isomerase C